MPCFNVSPSIDLTLTVERSLTGGLYRMENRLYHVAAPSESQPRRALDSDLAENPIIVSSPAFLPG